MGSLFELKSLDTFKIKILMLTFWIFRWIIGNKKKEQKPDPNNKKSRKNDVLNKEYTV